MQAVAGVVLRLRAAVGIRLPVRAALGAERLAVKTVTLHQPELLTQAAVAVEQVQQVGLHPRQIVVEMAVPVLLHQFQAAALLMRGAVVVARKIPAQRALAALEAAAQVQFKMRTQQQEPLILAVAVAAQETSAIQQA